MEQTKITPEEYKRLKAEVVDKIVVARGLFLRHPFPLVTWLQDYRYKNVMSGAQLRQLTAETCITMLSSSANCQTKKLNLLLHMKYPTVCLIT